jgi:hypothetical protein
MISTKSDKKLDNAQNKNSNKRDYIMPASVDIKMGVVGSIKNKIMSVKLKILVN